MTEFLSEEQLAQIQEVVSVFDKKGEHTIPAADLTIVFQALSCNVSNEEVKEYLTVLDPNSEGAVPYSELLPILAKRLQQKESVEQLIEAFRVFDREKRGTIAPEELRHILSHFGEVMDNTEIDEYIAEADLKAPDLRANGEKTGLINYLAFIGVMLDLTEDEIFQMSNQSSVPKM
mmetsp:Transcript_14237/g.22136  ORF Transcript_14237/g.22136 Transcript_14237/m.22136 type:complete len:176 (-) Transcript_14237:47-574(-)